MLALPTCIGTRDSLGTLLGRVVDENGQQHSDCRMELFYNEKLDIYSWRDLRPSTPPEKLAGFVIDPRQQIYRITIQCATAREVFKSGPFAMGGKSHTIVDLGDIVLRR